MLKNLLAIAVVLLCTQKSYCNNDNSSMQASQTGKQYKEILVSAQDLLIEQDDLFVNIEGNHYPVRALERRGSEWLVQVNSHNEFCSFCQNNVCKRCHLCHNVDCRRYLPPCWITR